MGASLGAHSTGAVEGSDVGLPVCVQKRGSGYTPAVVGGSVHLPRCSSESLGQAAGISSFNLASKFGKGGLGFLLEGKELTGKHGLSRPPPPCTDRGTIYKRPILLGTERQERRVCE